MRIKDTMKKVKDCLSKYDIRMQIEHCFNAKRLVTCLFTVFLNFADQYDNTFNVVIRWFNY